MISRRNILQGALFGAGLAAIPGRSSAQTQLRRGPLVPAFGNKKLLVVYQRGGNDGLNTVVPIGNMTDYVAVRPTLAITGGTLPMQGVSYSQLNPNLQRLLGIDLAGHLAAIHQFGYEDPSRSHFRAMELSETLAQLPINQAALNDVHGWIPRLLHEAAIAPLGTNGIPAALTVSLLMQRMFRAGDSLQLSGHVRNLASLALPFPMAALGIDDAHGMHAVAHYGSTDSIDKQLGANLAFGLQSHAALEGLAFAHPNPFPPTGRFPVATTDLAALSGHADAAVLPQFDPNGAGFMASLEQAVFALTHEPHVRVAGVEIGGWDTHGNQAAEHPNLLRYLGWGLRDAYDECQQHIPGDVLIICMTEFGRTVKENSSAGTDHGIGGAMLAMGANVVGGTYNIHNGSPSAKEFGAVWPLLQSASILAEDANEVKTGVRDVMAEICVRQFGLRATDLPAIVPGYPASTAAFADFLL